MTRVSTLRLDSDIKLMLCGRDRIVISCCIYGNLLSQQSCLIGCSVIEMAYFFGMQKLFNPRLACLEEASGLII